MDKIHIGQEIQKVLKSRDVSVTEFAKRINKSRANIYSIFSRQSLETDLLKSISDVLDFDFFKLYSSSYLQLEEQNAELEKQNKILNSLVELLMEKENKTK